VKLTVRVRREGKARFLASVLELPGVEGRGETPDEARIAVAALTLRTVADRVEKEPAPAEPLHVELVSEQTLATERRLADRWLVAACISIVVAVLGAILVVHAFRNDVVRRLPGVELADPSPQLEAKYGRADLFPGPIVVSVGPERKALGLGSVNIGDHIFTVETQRVETALELKQALTVPESRIVRGIPRRVFFVSTSSSKIQQAVLDLSGLRKIPRPGLAPSWLPDEALVRSTGVLPLLVIVAVFFFGQRHTKRPGLLLGWLLCLSAITSVTGFVVFDVLRTWGGSL